MFVDIHSTICCKPKYPTRKYNMQKKSAKASRRLDSGYHVSIPVRLQSSTACNGTTVNSFLFWIDKHAVDGGGEPSKIMVGIIGTERFIIHVFLVVTHGALAELLQLKAFGFQIADIVTKPKNLTFRLFPHRPSYWDTCHRGFTTVEVAVELRARANTVLSTQPNIFFFC